MKLDGGFEAVKVTLSNHATETSTKLESLTALNTEMADKWIQSSEVNIYIHLNTYYSR